MFFTSVCTTCLLCLYQPFMNIWMKDNNLILSFECVVCFCIYFYEINMNNTINLYLNGNGLFWNLRWWYILEATMNLFLNIILGKILGIFGVLLATVITILFFNFLPRVHIVFKEYFKNGKKEYYHNNLRYFSICVIVSIITFFCCSLISLNGLAGLVLKCVVSLTLSYLLYYIFYKNDDNYMNFIDLLRKRKTSFLNMKQKKTN